MKFHARIAVIIVAIFIVALTTESSAKPAEEEEERQLLPTPLSTLLGPLLGLFAGLALGQALGGLGGGNRRWGRRSGGGRRCGRDLGAEDDPLDKLEDDLMADMFNLMMQTQEEECYERMICDIASKDDAMSDFSDLLNFFSDEEALFVPEEYKDYSEKLRAARQFGEDVEHNEECELAYECPLSGEEMSTMMKEQFEDDTEE